MQNCFVISRLNPIKGSKLFWKGGEDKVWITERKKATQYFDLKEAQAVLKEIIKERKFEGVESPSIKIVEYTPFTEKDYARFAAVLFERATRPSPNNQLAA